MGFFSLGQNKIRYGVLIDIGSGSVLVSIIASDPAKTYPDIIWSKREYTPLRHINQVADSAKSVMTSLMNVLMTLDSEGRKTFFEKTGQHKLHNIQVAISAPWSYTVTKTISYQNNEEFEVSFTLIEELLRTAQQKAQEEMLENEKVNNLGLEIVARTTIQVMANGYPVEITGKQKALSLKVAEASAVVQEYLIKAIDDLQEKVFPGTNLKKYSFMLPYFYIIRDLNSTTSEYCLIDVTYESTEIGIVRDGVLNYCTHTPYGSFSIAREISNTLSVPLAEAYGYLCNQDFSSYIIKYTEKQKKEIEQIIESYRMHLAEIFKETGDSLSIPKRIYLHSDLKTESFFNKQIAEAATLATGAQHAVYDVTTELLTKHYPNEIANALKASEQDTALLISAQFFHSLHLHDKFEHF